jgi:hypothetical protein
MIEFQVKLARSEQQSGTSLHITLNNVQTLLDSLRKHHVALVEVPVELSRQDALHSVLYNERIM